MKNATLLSEFAVQRDGGLSGRGEGEHCSGCPSLEGPLPFPLPPRASCEGGCPVPCARHSSRHTGTEPRSFQALASNGDQP